MSKKDKIHCIELSPRSVSCLLDLDCLFAMASIRSVLAWQMVSRTSILEWVASNSGSKKLSRSETRAFISLRNHSFTTQCMIVINQLCISKFKKDSSIKALFINIQTINFLKRCIDLDFTHYHKIQISLIFIDIHHSEKNWNKTLSIEKSRTIQIFCRPDTQ